MSAAVIVADPPWQPRDLNSNGNRGAAHKYATLSTAEVCALELPPRAERNVLFLWRLASMQRDAFAVLDAWGYIDCTEVVWVKLRPCATCCATGVVDTYRAGEGLVMVPGRTRVCPECDGERGKPMLGLGHYVRGAHEVAIVARPKRGRAPERLDLGVPSVLAAPMLLDVDGLLGDRGRLVHSAKPDAFFNMVERLYPGPRVELFSRRRRPGWVVLGDEDGKLDEVARVMREAWPQRERAARIAAAGKAEARAKARATT